MRCSGLLLLSPQTGPGGKQGCNDTCVFIRERQGVDNCERGMEEDVERGGEGSERSANTYFLDTDIVNKAITFRIDEYLIVRTHCFTVSECNGAATPDAYLA